MSGVLLPAGIGDSLQRFGDAFLAPPPPPPGGPVVPPPAPAT